MPDQTTTKTVAPPTVAPAPDGLVALRTSASAAPSASVPAPRVADGTLQEAPWAGAHPRALGRYELVTRIGAGGMGDVWLARTRAQGNFVRFLALKLLRSDLVTDPRARERFLREAQIAASIHHANVVDVTDVGEEAGTLYQAMTLVDGDSLAGLLRSVEALPLGVLLSIVVDALRGLAAAHESVDPRGVPRALVHRDVSPQNILVGRDGVARISDFGIARLIDDDESTGTMPGKHAYFAPEQVGRQPVDARADIFAMGVVTWEALTRRRLFKRDNTLETLEAVRGFVIPDPREHVPELPEPVIGVVMKALERAPADRHPSAAAMADALASAAASCRLVLARDAVADVVDRAAGPRRWALLEDAARSMPSPVPPAAVAPPAPESHAGPPASRRRSWVGLAIAIAVVAALAAVVLLRARALRGEPDRELANSSTASEAQSASSAPILVRGASAAETVPSSPLSAPAPPASTPGARAITTGAPRAPSRPRASTAGATTTRVDGASRKPPFTDNPFNAKP